MRILHIITPSHLGGAELLVFWIAQTQMRRGDTVRVLCKPHQAFFERSKREGVDAVQAPISGKFNLLAIPAIRTQIARFQPDLICTHLSSASLWGALAARSCGIPCVAMVHGFTRPFFYRFAPTLICVSQAVANSMQAQGIAAPRLKVVRNGICPTPFYDAEPADISLPPETFCVGSAAHLSPKKGFQELVEVAKRVELAHFVVAGEGKMKAWLERMSREKLSGRLHLLGFREDMPAIMNRFDIFCLPSKCEPFGLVLLEAMAAGKPTVAFRSGGVQEVIVDGETGLLVNSGDIDAMAESIRKLQRDPVLRQRMGEAGRTRVQTCFTLEQAMDNLNQVFQEERTKQRDRIASCG